MKPLNDTPANDRKVALLQRVMAEILVDTCQRGFYGSATLEFHVVDGTIQDIRRKTERVQR